MFAERRNAIEIDAASEDVALSIFVFKNFAAGDGWGADYVAGTFAAYRRASGTWAQPGTRASSTYQAQSGYLGINMESTTGRLDDFGGGNTFVGNPWYYYAQQ